MGLQNIYEIAKKAKIDQKYIEPYGSDKAKIDLAIFDEIKNKKNGKLVLVTAITPTKVGEGKTTMSIALCDGLARIGKNVMLALREPSLGPVFGLKGGATGGERATVEPHEDINLHFTGDMHALTSSINLVSAIIDNHIFQGNELNIDPDKVVWKRAMDMNDRALRNIQIALGNKNGTPRNDGFLITVASEMMAILCLSNDPEDFKKRINNILVAYTFDDKPIYLRDLRISNAIMKLMKQALKPNLVQTGEGNPALIHGGPFANIAHGCNSIIALKLAEKISDITVTEAGFGADLGAEKFMDICMPTAKLSPDAVVVVATIRALKLHGGVVFEQLNESNVEAMLDGTKNLQVHLENMKKYGVPVMVAINHFNSDSQVEIDALTKWCVDNNYHVSFVDSYIKGSEGAIDFANKVCELLNQKSNYHTLYDYNLSIKEKIEIISKEIYRAEKVEFSDKAIEQIVSYEKLGYGHTAVCMAKTPLSLTDNAKIQGAPIGHIIHVKSVNLSSGANFVVALTGAIMTMPGLPKVPAAVKMEDE
jgi:formate--tetrahydrofolate ligase